MGFSQVGVETINFLGVAGPKQKRIRRIHHPSPQDALGTIQGPHAQMRAMPKPYANSLQSPASYYFNRLRAQPGSSGVVVVARWLCSRVSSVAALTVWGRWDVNKTKRNRAGVFGRMSSNPFKNNERRRKNRSAELSRTPREAARVTPELPI